MDPAVLSQFNAGWASHAQSLAINAQHDSRALTAAIAGNLVRADDASLFASLNTGARTPTTIEHIPYPGYSYPAKQA